MEPVKARQAEKRKLKAADGYYEIVTGVDDRLDQRLKKHELMLFLTASYENSWRD